VKARTTYLIAYDIREPRRLGRVYRCCRRTGLHLQYSVFLVRATMHQLDGLIRELESLIDPRRDDVRIYPVPERPEWTHLGRSLWPSETQFFHEGLDFLPLPQTTSTLDGTTTHHNRSMADIDSDPPRFSCNCPAKRLKRNRNSTRADQPKTCKRRD
jgi:CRISPR-associated protein Cas2